LTTAWYCFAKNYSYVSEILIILFHFCTEYCRSMFQDMVHVYHWIIVQ